jgi:cobalt-zinc-cadmium efflux system outer membrane protein
MAYFLAPPGSKSRIAIGIGIGLMLLLFGAVALADTSTGLNSLTELALANNPGIAAAKRQAAAAAANVSPAGVLPDPELMIESMDNPLGSSMGMTSPGFEFSWMQMIPFPGKRPLAVERQQAAADAAAAAHAMKRADVQKDVALMYYGIAAMDAQLAIEAKKQKQLEAMGKVIAAEYSNGKASLSEFIRTNTMKAMAKTEILTMEAERARMAAELAAMLGGAIPEGTVFGYEVAPLRRVPDEAEMVEAALQKFPEIGMKQAMERGMAAEARQMKLEAAPDFTVRGAIQRMDSGDQTYSLGIAVPLPLFRSQKQTPLARAAADLSESATQERLDAANRIAQEVRARRAALVNAQEALGLLGSSIKKGAEQAFEVALKDYQSGRINFNELLEAFRMLYDTALEQEKTKRLVMEERVYLDFYTVGSLRWEEKP